ncbi:esterase-like activity of phytase family protein [Sphingomonas sp. CCH5-D11]|uniref:esterase-like activity of phytase family protein n=1 Tax=Sphingomonas sp. CCH5-D11 TaxID=1768786 RepID=UPI000AA981AE|nr:esterase-like activity of phytase family protein [Sphingomonas sp. CCH5-D11]
MKPARGVMRWMFCVVAVLLVVPRYAGNERLPLISAAPSITVARYVPPGGWPARIGQLTPLAGHTLRSHDPAFGGFSAIAWRGGRAFLMSDGGNVVSFALRQDVAIGARGHVLADGPAIGWDRADRDSESLILDPASGTAWVGFENQNEIWRYRANFQRVEGHRAPDLMRSWVRNQGAEAFVRLHDGRFVAFAERQPNRRSRHAVLFSGDPTDPKTRAAPFRFLTPDRFDPSDATVLPGGDLLILTRRFRYPFSFSAKLVRVPVAALRPGAQVRGKVIATLAAPVMRENCEGIAVTQEAGATIVWIVTDNDGMPFRPSYLLKFRLN